MESWSTLPFWGFIVCLVMMEKSALQIAARGWVSEGGEGIMSGAKFFHFYLVATRVGCHVGAGVED